MHADRTAVTVPSNKIVSNEVKDNYALLEPSYRKMQMNFLINPIKLGLGPEQGTWCPAPAQVECC